MTDSPGAGRRDAGKLLLLAMGCYNTCVYAGMMLCAAGMGPVIRGEGFRVGFFLNGAVGVAVLLLFMTLYRRPAPEAG